MKHEISLQKYIKIFQKKGYKVIRLDHRSVPDAILLKDNKVSALLIDTGSLSMIEDIRRYWKDNTEHNVRNYSEFDKIIQVCPKHKRGHSIEEYESAINMHKQGLTMYRIAKELHISYSIIFEWIKNGVVPHSISDKNTLENMREETKKEVLLIEEEE